MDIRLRNTPVQVARPVLSNHGFANTDSLPEQRRVNLQELGQYFTTQIQILNYSAIRQGFFYHYIAKGIVNNRVIANVFYPIPESRRRLLGAFRFLKPATKSSPFLCCIKLKS